MNSKDIELEQQLSVTRADGQASATKKLSAAGLGRLGRYVDIKTGNISGLTQLAPGASWFPIVDIAKVEEGCLLVSYYYEECFIRVGTVMRVDKRQDAYGYQAVQISGPGIPPSGFWFVSTTGIGTVCIATAADAKRVLARIRVWLPAQTPAERRAACCSCAAKPQAQRALPHSLVGNAAGMTYHTAFCPARHIPDGFYRATVDYIDKAMAAALVSTVSRDTVDARWLPPSERRSDRYKDVYRKYRDGEAAVGVEHSYADTERAVRAGLAECDTSIVTPWDPEEVGW